MKRAILERNIALILFVVVLLVFSRAQKACSELEAFYTNGQTSIAPKAQKPVVQAIHSNQLNPYFIASQKQ
jgi:hypothetical protein